MNLQGTFLLAKIPKPNNSEKTTGFGLKDISNQHQEDASRKKKNVFLLLFACGLIFLFIQRETVYDLEVI